MKLREDSKINAAIEVMENSFDTQDDPYVGPFWYDPNKDEVYGNIMALASDKPFYHSYQFNKDVRTGNALHQNIWKKESFRGKDKRFSGDYTLKPRGRVFEFKDDGFKVCVGKWINDFPNAKKEIIDVFQLPEKTEFIIDERFDIGHTWSQEF